MTDLIASRAPGLRPGVAVILGSGLGAFADTVEAAAVIPYADLPGFPETTVSSHAGRLVLGHVGPTPVAVLQGRAHYYERGRADEMKGAIRAMAELGCETLLQTNAAGSLRLDMPPGSLMAITDHINFTGVNPLFGSAAGGGRFVDMVDAYDPVLTAELVAAARSVNVPCHEGVYIWFCGPSFETPAEIRAARILGADAVGMSTAPETILARHAGMKVVALSLMTNYAAGLVPGPLGHEQTIAVAKAAAGNILQPAHPIPVVLRIAMLPQEIIRRKRDGHELSERGDRAHRARASRDGSLSEGQVAAFAMAVFFSGMSTAERVALTLGDGALGHRARLEGAVAARPGDRQAFERRRGRQGEPDAGADRRGVRRCSCR